MLTKEQQLKEWDRVIAMCKGTNYEGREYLYVKALCNPKLGVDSKQIGGSHYKAKAIQPWQYMEANFTKEEFIGFLKGNAHKYLDRSKDKNGIEDLKKAIHYIEKLIQVESK